MKGKLLLFFLWLLFNVTMWLYVSKLLLYTLLLQLCNIAAVHVMCIYCIYLMIATLHMATVTICQCNFISHNVTVYFEICCPVILRIYLTIATLCNSNFIWKCNFISDNVTLYLTILTLSFFHNCVSISHACNFKLQSKYDLILFIYLFIIF